MKKKVGRFGLQVNCLVALLFLAQCVSSQNTSLVTGKPDTSYTTWHAYQYDKKSHPEIAIVQPFHYDDVVATKDLVYCERGERKLLTDVFAPRPGKGNGICIIIVHGGGWRTGSRTQHYPLAEALAHLGYTCFTPEYRLSTEALFPAAVYDVKAVIRWVRSQVGKYGIDSNKLVVAGFSAGGELAAFMGTTGNMPLFEGSGCNENISTAIDALIDIDGTLSFTHPDGREGDDSKSISAGTAWFGYSKAQQPELWEAASPLPYTDSTAPPTLFINSSVPWMHAGREDYIKILNKYGIYSVVHEFDKAPHSFCLYHPWFEPTVEYIDKFLKTVFKKD